MLSFGQVLVETPENLHNGEGSRGNWVGEITTGRGDSTDNGDGTFAVGGSEALDAAGTFVEMRQL